MNDFAIKGWCPGALRPMQSGDGLVVRIRPHGGRLSPAQAARIADLADRFGNGAMDVTNRANLQIRGVDDADHAQLIAALAELDLVDADPTVETVRNIMVTPFQSEADDAASLAADLEIALATRRPDLPGKFGFAIDCGPVRVLANASADVRIERAETGGLIVRADGADLGRPVTQSEAVTIALDFADWFVTSGGADGRRGRMAAHLAAGTVIPVALAGSVRPAPMRARVAPGIEATGALVGLAFGQLTAATLRMLAEKSRGLRLTPWRMLLVEGMREMPAGDGLVTQAGDPLLRVFACPGAPTCREAHAETRTVAAALAPEIADDVELHVSGCAKGCAHPGAASLTLVATPHGFDLIRDGSAREVAILRGVSRARLHAELSLPGHFS